MNTSENTSATETTTKSSVETFLSEYKVRIADSAEAFKAELFEVLVGREIDERVALVDAALKQLTELERDVKKLEKPDTRFRNAKQEVVMECLSEKKAEELKNAQEKYNKLSDALELALGKNDFKKLKELKK